MKKTQKTILIVDDNIDILEALQLLLEDAGYKVVITENVDVLDQLVQKYKPNVILMDLLLSGKDGRDIIAKLKKNKVTKNIPVILNSAHPNAKNMWKASGADDFIAKPFDIDVLLSCIHDHLP